MPASTSTVTTSSRSPKGKDSKNARLRVENTKEDKDGGEVERVEPLEVKEHDFFWTYTEEPHRTRRMAIIKAHPEVCLLPLPSPSSPSLPTLQSHLTSPSKA